MLAYVDIQNQMSTSVSAHRARGNPLFSVHQKPYHFFRQQMTREERLTAENVNMLIENLAISSIACYS